MDPNEPGEAGADETPPASPITERPIQVSEADDQLRLFVEAVPDYAIFLLDPVGRIATWNRGGENILGYPASEIVGEHFDLIFTPEDRERGAPDRELREAAAQGRADAEGWLQKKDGSCFWANGLTVAIRGAGGQLHGFCKTLRDQTERHRAEEERKASAERDRRIAEALQRAMLIPLKENQFPGVSVATLHEAAWEEAQVGGDFYDGFLISDDLLALAVGDASGKGLAAAVRTTQIKDVLRAFLRSLVDADAPRTLARLNDYLCDSQRLDGDPNGEEGFVALSLVLLDTATGEATVSLAGAEPPMILRVNGEVETVELHGLPLGTFPHWEYPSQTIRLEPGDVLLLVTDGLTEVRRGSEFLSLEGLTDLIRGARAAGSMPEMAQAILDGVKAFAGGNLHDDACLLLAQRRAR